MTNARVMQVATSLNSALANYYKKSEVYNKGEIDLSFTSLGFNLDFANKVDMHSYTSASDYYTTPKCGVLFVQCGDLESSRLDIYDLTADITVYRSTPHVIYDAITSSGNGSCANILVNKGAKLYITSTVHKVFFVPMSFYVA